MNSLSWEKADELLRQLGPRARVYMVGIGGCGMSGLGHLLLDLGCRIAGSDLAANESIEQLRGRGADVQIGHNPERLLAFEPNLLVYSSAIAKDNLEMKAALERGVPIVRRAILLAALLHRKTGICVAGMHGKTTTTSMLAYALRELGADPSFAIGAHVPQFERHARFVAAHDPQHSNLFVAETDESDGTLRQFAPDYSILLNVDEEHLDYFTDLQAVCTEFEQFAKQTRKLIVYCSDEAPLREFLSDKYRAVSYGFGAEAAYRIKRLEHGNEFEIWCDDQKLGTFEISLLGEKNVSNAAAVITLLHQLGYPAQQIAGALFSFRGAARRQHELFRDERFRIFDDYGHHPAEIEATIKAMHQLAPRRLLVAFQPHRYTRTRQLLKQFASCFKGADVLWITDIYSANEAEIPGVSGDKLVNAVRQESQRVEYAPTLEKLRTAVRTVMQPGDVVLFLGAGDITGVAHQLAADLKQHPVRMREQIFSRITQRISDTTILRKNEPMAKRTTLRVGGPADYYVEPSSEADLAAILRFCAEEKLPFLILGRGSNLLVKDGGVRGVVISLSQPRFSEFRIDGERLICGAGVRLKTVAVEAKRHGLAGLEFIEGIPGSVGGALRMNAGAMGSWFFDVVESIRFMDYLGQIYERGAQEVRVEYRGCPLFKNHIALGATLVGQAAPKEAVAQRMNGFSQKRWKTQPAAPSAGCIFKNTSIAPAGKLIDELGLKGTRVGGAVVSDIHGNFIINEGNATATDVLKLIDLIKQRAKAARGIDLETEVEIIGE
ncbi:MAG TPA: UDP-N-acetylmuramate--L-alanine ligase [Verrucomicrobiae bacterium]|nr:UDP-N-acetylmuramate--L-alanine ligase [Verrucomicrobiae bacterium]